LIAGATMKKLVYKLPLSARLLYWSGFAYLTKRGKLLSGKPEEHNFAPSIGTYFFKKGEKSLLKYCKSHVPEQTSDIPVLEISKEEATVELLREIRKAQIPVLIKGGASHWAAMTEFTLEFFEERYGDIEVPVHSEPNKIFKDDGKPVPLSNFYQMSYVKVKELIQSVRQNGEYSAKAIEDIMHVEGNKLIKEYCDTNQIHMFSDFEEKKKKWYYKNLPIGRVMSEQIFIQPPRSHTLWHAEPGDNYFVAVQGVKNWRLVPPYFSAGMYPVIKDSSVYHVSKVDGRESNDTISRRGFPLYQYVPKYSARVEPSDILILPNYWWHTVTNIPTSPSISLTFRTLSELNLAAPIFWLLKKFDPKSKEIRQKVLKHGRLFDDDIAASLYAFADPKNDLVKQKQFRESVSDVVHEE
jgi:hypothetical protein